MNNYHDSVLALAGVFQAAALVKELAWHGKSNENYLKTSINSIFSINSESVSDIYGSPENLKPGLQEILKLFDNKNKNKDPEIAKYVFSLIHVERKVIKNKQMLNIIQNGILKAKNQSEIFSILHENVIANLAGIYTDTISKLPFRIYVTGNPSILNNSDVVNKVRAILLAGIRSTVLWYQLGGSRLQLIFNRRKIINTAKSILNEW